MAGVAFKTFRIHLHPTPGILPGKTLGGFFFIPSSCNFPILLSGLESSSLRFFWEVLDELLQPGRPTTAHILGMYKAPRSHLHGFRQIRFSKPRNGLQHSIQLMK